MLPKKGRQMGGGGGGGGGGMVGVAGGDQIEDPDARRAIVSRKAAAAHEALGTATVERGLGRTAARSACPFASSLQNDLPIISLSPRPFWKAPRP